MRDSGVTYLVIGRTLLKLHVAVVALTLTLSVPYPLLSDSEVQGSVMVPVGVGKGSKSLRKGIDDRKQTASTGLPADPKLHVSSGDRRCA